MPLIREALAGADVVALEWARRTQGLLLAAGNPKRIRKIADLARKGLRIAKRQPGAGSDRLFRHLLTKAGLDADALATFGRPAHAESELAAFVRDGHADVGLGILLARPLLQALEDSPSVLLVDEVDRADDEFEAFLLEVLSDFTISIPELGTVRAVTPPLVILTSNRTREVHDALKRRCLYHWLEHPDFDREVAILRRRLPQVTEQLAREVARATAKLRTLDLLKPPGIAEAMDWATALHTLGARDLDPDLAARTLGAVLKYREDTDRVHALARGALFGG